MSVVPARAEVRRDRGKGVLEGRIAIVTGGSVGIGAAIVRLFADEGAKVIFCARSEQPGRDLERELKAAGHDVAFVARDIALEDEARQST